jgi:hypothetical protein
MSYEMRSGEMVDFGRQHAKRGYPRRSFTATSNGLDLPIELLGPRTKFFSYATSPEARANPATQLDIYLGEQAPGEYREEHTIRVTGPDGTTTHDFKVTMRGTLAEEDDGSTSTIISQLVRDKQITEEDAFQRYWPAVAAHLRGDRSVQYIWRLTVKRIENTLRGQVADLSPQAREDVCQTVSRKLWSRFQKGGLPTHPAPMTGDFIGETVRNCIRDHWKKLGRVPRIGPLDDSNVDALLQNPPDAIAGDDWQRSVVSSFREAVVEALLDCPEKQRQAWQDPTLRVDTSQNPRANRSRAVRAMVESLEPTYGELMAEFTGDDDGFMAYDQPEKMIKQRADALNKQLTNAKWIQRDADWIPVVLAEFQ